VADLYNHVGNQVEKQNSRIAKIELRIAMWAGGLVVLVFLAKYLIEMIQKGSL
jgi:hypothetical protein